MDKLTIDKPLGQALEAPKQARASRRKLILTVLGLAVIGGGAFYGHQWWTVGRFLQETDDAYIGADVVSLSPYVAGMVTKVAVRDNEAVKAGQLLVTIDRRPFQAVLDKAEAAIQGQQANLSNIEANYRLQLSLIDEAKAGLASAEAQVSQTKLDQDRYQRLSTTSVTPIETYQKAVTAYQQAVASKEKADATLAAEKQKLAVLDTQRDQAKAELANAAADKEKALLDMGYTEIRSPVDGVIGNRSAREGGYAPLGAELLSVIPSSGLWVDANFKESQLGRLHVGQSVDVEADIFPGEIFRGRVESIAPGTGSVFSVLPAENATGNFTKIVQRVPVRIALDGDASMLGRLRPGLSVVAEIDTRQDGQH